MENQQTIGNYFKSLQILHASLCAGAAVALGIMRYLVKHEPPAGSAVIMEVTGAAFAFIAVLAARFLFFMRTRPAVAAVTMREKLEIFRNAYIIQLALLEAAVMINAILYLTGRADLNFFIGIGALLLMLFRRPTRAIAAMVLFNAAQDMQQIYNDDASLE
jgi:hypothetical protein